TAQLSLSDNAYLRPLTVKDICNEYVDGLNDPVVQQYLVLVRRPKQTYITVKKYVNFHIENHKNILFGLFIDNGLRGTVRMHDIDLTQHKSAWIGITIFDRDYWKKGWGSCAISAVTEFGKKKLNLDCIYAGIYPD